MVEAIGSGGILFSLLGFRSAMDMAGEVRNPQRNVPLAMAVGLGICLLIYLVLQLSFLVSVPPESLHKGWSQLSLTAHGGPLVALAVGLGLSWVALVLLIDAVVSPSATGMAYLGISARVSWMMGECRLLPGALGRLNSRGVPHWALLSSLIISMLLLWLTPSWQGLVSFLTSTQIIALAMGPVSLLALRRQLPDAERRFQVPCPRMFCSLAFVMATWATSWTGRTALEGAVLVISIPSLMYVLVRSVQGQAHGPQSRAVVGSLSGSVDPRHGTVFPRTTLGLAHRLAPRSSGGSGAGGDANGRQQRVAASLSPCPHQPDAAAWSRLRPGATRSSC